MEGGGETQTRVDRSTGTRSLLLPASRSERRAAATTFLAEMVLSDEEEGEEEELLCSDILSSFINSLQDQQWERIRERMREPLTQAHMARVSRRIIRVVSELVFQLLVPALMVRLQTDDVSEASASKSSEQHHHSEGEPRSKDSRSSPVMVRNLAEDPLKKYFRVSEENLAQALGSSASQSSARSMLVEVVQQVNQGLSVLAAYTPPHESPAETRAEPAQEQVAEVMSATMKSLGLAGEALAEVASWQDVDQFLEAAPGEVISALADSLAICQEKREAGVKTESAAGRILRHLAVKMRCPKRTEEETEDQCLDKFDQDSLGDFGSGYCCCCWYLDKKFQRSTGKVRDAFEKSREDETQEEANLENRDGSHLQDIGYPTSVSPAEVVKDLSCRRFRCTSLTVLKGFLMRLLVMFSPQSLRALSTSCEPVLASVDSAASEMLDAVVNSVNQLCQPQPRRFTFPWQQTENTTVSEDQVASTALVLKLSLQEKLQNFFNFHKKVSDKLECKTETSTSLRDMTDENTQEDTAVHSIHSTETGSRKSRVSGMADVVSSFMSETELSLKQDGSIGQSVDAPLTRLEELISHDKLVTFSKLLADKVSSMFHKQAQSLAESQDPNRNARSDSDLSQPTTGAVGVITPSEEVYLFVEEAVKRLLTSLLFPPPSWGMGHMIQVQSGATSAADWAESVKKYDNVISRFSQMLANQVMAGLRKVSAAARLQQNIQDPLKAQGKDIQDEGCSADEVLDGDTKLEKNHFLQELPGRIRRKWRTLANKEV
ncbi:uncharacterized protein LOC121901517 isoform X1 [Thunnus maccoyii]|uniref:uncharacterized protein LOC121901517 isoform X1 n=1 Tax=Thunnus maccoyii TaxID=8240 RepID=UPI001C4D39A4|nr:uncharacterized protein LOC121901517 isoform X1 [Thunnus maccoyii]